LGARGATITGALVGWGGCLGWMGPGRATRFGRGASRTLLRNKPCEGCWADDLRFEGAAVGVRMG